MKNVKKKNSKFYLVCSLLGLGLLWYNIGFAENTSKETEQSNDSAQADNKKFKPYFDQCFMQPNDWPKQVSIGNKPHLVEYTFNDQLSQYVRAQLKQYRTDYATVVVVDNDSGEILAAQGYNGKDQRFDQSLVTTATHPSASLIKIITASDLVGKGSVTKDTMFEFKGRSTTLFKYQLTDGRGGPARPQDFQTAFAKSNNVIFGKAAIGYSSPADLVKTAEEFGFNHPMLSEISTVSKITQTNDSYEFAELASGFNNTTVISPIHGAMFASVIANDGVLKTPKFISSVKLPNKDENLWQKSAAEKRIMNPRVADEIKTLMGATIEEGTARKSFRQMNRAYRDLLIIGGKTGSITGGKPFGKRDWFAAYAVPRDPSKGRGISISVMNVNVKKWHVKSSFLAKNIIEYYFRNVKNVPITLAAPEKVYRQTKVRMARNVKTRRSIASKPRRKTQGPYVSSMRERRERAKKF